MANEHREPIHVTFKHHPVPDRARSSKEGRPCYRNIEVCMMRYPGNQYNVGVFPAHDVSRQIPTDDGSFTAQTYAERFPDQYAAFKRGDEQAQSGTPLEELTFLDEAKRLELKALNIYTAEALASVDGAPLKKLGMGGRELKNKAQRFLDTAQGFAKVDEMAETIERLQKQIADMQNTSSPSSDSDVETEKSLFADFGDDDLKEFIKDATGAAPRGQPNRETLIRMAEDANKDLEKKNKEAA